MSDQIPDPAKRMAAAEEKLKGWLERADLLDALVTLRQLKILLPYQSSHIGDLDAQIRAELKRAPRSLT